jgi:hypothetical protein
MSQFVENPINNSTYYYDNSRDYSNGYNVAVVGCGGIGSRVIPLIAQELGQRGNAGELLLIDGDVIEPKNFARQNFIAKDVGVNKAEVLARRYSIFFKNITYCPEFLSHKNMYQTVQTSWRDDNLPLIILSGVDNLYARALLYQNFIGNVPGVLIDGGNDIEYGQVHIFPTDVRINPGIPIPFLLTEEVELDKPREDMSCAELGETTPQLLSVNNMAAAMMFQVFSSLIDNKPLCYGQLKFTTSGDLQSLPFDKFDRMHTLRDKLSIMLYNARRANEQREDSAS